MIRVATRDLDDVSPGGGLWVHHRPRRHADRSLHQIIFFRSVTCTGARRNPAAWGTNQGDRTRQFAPPLSAGGQPLGRGAPPSPAARQSPPARAVPRLARISGSWTCVSLNSRLESNEEDEEEERDQIIFFSSLICTGAHRNPAAWGIHKEDRTRRFTPSLRAC